jgi:site-specific DNA-methyltransferase (adenine-specific)
MNELINCDCMDYMKTCKDKQFDLAIVDPPYGIGISENPVRQMYEKKEWDTSIPKKQYFDELMRVSKNQIIWGGNYFNLSPTQNYIVWNKIQPENFSLAMCELAWCSIQIPIKMFSYSVLTERNKIHPTQKPVALYKWLLSHYAHAGDSLLDTHSGSGSFRIAAYDMGFDLVSCEIDADYCRDNEARYQAHIMQQELIPVQEIQQLTFGDKK